MTATKVRSRLSSLARCLCGSLPLRRQKIRPPSLGADPAKGRAAGFALILVLCVLAVLSVIAVTLIRETREETRFESAVIEDAKAEALAEGGVEQSIVELLIPPGHGAWQTDGSLHEIHLGEGVVLIRIEDESGRIDLNRTGEATLVSMLVSVGLEAAKAEHLAAAIVDYRSPRNIKTPGGAEAVDYEAAGLHYGPKHGPFDAPEELMQVLGMTPEIMQAIEPLVTVYSPRPDVNRQAASAAVLRALPGGYFDNSGQSAINARAAVSPATVIRVTAAATTQGGGHFIREVILLRTMFQIPIVNILSWRRRWPPSP